MSRVSQRLHKAIIVKCGLTVTEAARQLQIARPALSNVLHGHAELSVDLALKVEAAFHLNAKRLLVAQLQEQLEAARIRRQERNAAWLRAK